MSKSTNFFGQPVYGQLINHLTGLKLLILTMLFAVIMRFDSLREIEATMTAEVRKLAHWALRLDQQRQTFIGQPTQRHRGVDKGSQNHRFHYNIAFLQHYIQGGWTASQDREKDTSTAKNLQSARR